MSCSRSPCLGWVVRTPGLLVQVAVGVDRQARPAVGPAQDVVVLLLEPARPLAGALRDGPEQLRRQRAVRVLAHVGVGDHDARELLRPLAHVVELRTRDVGADRDVGVGRLGQPADHALMDGRGPDLQDAADAPVELGQLRLGGVERRDRHRRGRARRGPQPLRLAPLGARGAAAVVAQLALERLAARLRVQAGALGGRERGVVVVALLALGGRQRRGHELHDRRRPRRDQLVVVAVDDVSARRLDRQLAAPVALGDRLEAASGEHLQRPQAEEHGREQDERDRPENGDPPRQLGRDRRYSLISSSHH